MATYHKNVRGSRSGNAGRHIDEGFVVDVHRFAAARQNVSNLTTFVGAQVRRTRPHSHTLSDHGRSVGHAPYYFFESASSEFRYRLPGNDRKHYGVLVRLGPAFREFGEEIVREVLRLDAAHNQVGIFQQRRDRRTRLDAELFDDAVHRLGTGVEHEHLVGRLYPLLNHGL